MGDDPIRELLAGVTPQPFWAPSGYVAILEQRVLDAGGDLDAVETWVESKGGRPDRTVPAAKRSVFSTIPVPDSVRYFIVPEAALKG